ncbi:PfkB family carbohydrate kinase [Microbacterium sp. ASV49]|uniref:PfkB family carbohydrate kinase n=1 Tax=Microbacterium candidum TaxID=3041922 RepID=A0ABT7MXV3_9MICO|nr:PfkB family carbohydrate kinase [Microbacterium sp. ASV49]MDL9979260.1 PfkB family carbohydrate kinase [Microbacterium sp. ASV49]
MAAAVKVLGFGDNVIDRFIDRRIDYPGGNCVNFAVFAHELGIDAAYMGAFGSDGSGDFLRSELAAIGLDVSHAVVRDGETGIAMVEVVDGDRVFRGGNEGGVSVREPILLTREDLRYVDGFDLVHSSVYSASEAQIPLLSAADVLVTYDFSSEDHFRSPEYLDPLAPHLDLALLSCSHLGEAETGELLRSVVAKGAGLALGTRGADGSLLFDGSELHRVGAVPLVGDRPIADTMGCGDALLAAVVSSLLASGWRKGVAPSAGAIDAALSAGSSFAAEQCFIDGAFGHGRPTPDSARRRVEARVDSPSVG